MRPFHLAVLNLFRRPLTTWIAIFGIASAVAASGILLKIYLLSQSRFKTLALEGQSVVGAKAGGIEILLGSLNLEGAYPGFVPLNLYNSIRNQQTVQFEDGAQSKPSFVHAVIPFLYFANYDIYRVIGTSPEFMKRPLASDSPQFASGVWPVNGDEVVIGASVAADRDLKIGSSLHARTAIGEMPRGFDLKVAGILKPTGKIWDYALFTTLDSAQARLEQVGLRDRSIWGSHVLSYFLIYHEDSALPELKSLIDQRTVGQLISIQHEVEELQDLTGTGRTFGILLTSLILFLSSSSVASMMIARFDSMSTQLAILRAIGFERSEISCWLLWEGIILGVIACAIGGAVDIALFPWIRGLSGLNLPAFVPNPILQSAIVWIAAMFVTIAAVAIPLLRLYRQDVNASLKS